MSDRTQFTFKKMCFTLVWRMGWKKGKVEAERPVRRCCFVWERNDGGQGQVIEVEIEKVDSVY